jgi:hypothetical protein
LALLVTIGLVPDGILVWLLVPHGLWIVSLLLTVLDVYAAVWFWDLYASMVYMPHQIHDDALLLNNGFMQHVRLNYQSITDVEAVGTRNKREMRRLDRAAAILSFGGVPTVLVRTSAPVTVTGWFSTSTFAVFVASDDAQRLTSRIRALSTRSISL